MAVEPEHAHSKGKSRLAGLLLAGLILLVFGFANIPLQYVEVDGKWIGSLDYENVQAYQQYQTMPRLAGWPLNYWVQYETEGVVEDRFWSTIRLVGNVCIAIFVSWIVYAFIQLRRHHTGVGKHRRRNNILFDVGIALAVLGVPALVVGWQHRIANQHKRVARQLSRFGSCHLSCWLPEVLVDQVPSGWTGSFVRLRQVYLVRSNPSVEEYVTGLPSLIALGCLRGQFDLDYLDNLSNKVHLGGLQLNGYKLTNENAESIARLPWVVSMDLSESEFDTAMLLGCEQPRLRSLRLDYSTIVLADLGEPAWSNTIEELRLTRPLDRGDSLTIDKWPNLKHLSVKRLSSKRNPVPLEIELSNLPRLESLSLSRLQKHRLVLRNVPRLNAINDGIAELRFVISTDDLVPGLTWLSGLEIDGAPSLTTIGCFARDLETLTIRNAPNLREARIGSFKTSLMSRMTLEPADSLRCQSWIDEIGRRQGPGTVDFTGLPLEEADLTPLANNAWIRHLRFGASGVSFRQIQGLAGMEQLESLDVRSCKLKRDELSWVLEQFPNLQQLIANGTDLTDVHLTSGLQLKKFNTTRLENLDRIRIVGLPSLKSRLRLLRAPSELVIRDAQSLQGLALEAPWPKNASVSGLRDLEWFAGGGREVDDEIVNALLDCRSLDQLILAYPSISRQKMIELGQLSELTLLAVPGAKVDDDITKNWRFLKSLREINLDDTAVSVGTIAWLSGIESLRSASFNRVPLTPAAADAIAELRQLSELNLAGVAMDPMALEPLLNGGNLESLDLSGCQLGEDALEMLQRAFSLKRLVLHDCGINRSTLEKLIQANDTLYVDIGDGKDIVTASIAVELEERAFAIRHFSDAWRDATRMNDAVNFMGGNDSGQRGGHTAGDFGALTMADVAGSIDPKNFRPESLRVNKFQTESIE